MVYVYITQNMWAENLLNCLKSLILFFKDWELIDRIKLLTVAQINNTSLLPMLYLTILVYYQFCISYSYTISICIKIYSPTTRSWFLLFLSPRKSYWTVKIASFHHDLIWHLSNKIKKLLNTFVEHSCKDLLIAEDIDAFYLFWNYNVFSEISNASAYYSVDFPMGLIWCLF